MKYGFVRVAAAVPKVRVGDVDYNVAEIERLTMEAEDQKAEVIVFPELSVTGYTCQDLFGQKALLDAAEHAVEHLLEFTEEMNLTLMVGIPVVMNNMLLNCAAVIHRGFLGIVTKTYLPNYGEFYEKRWFAAAADMNGGKMWYAGRMVDVEHKILFQTANGLRLGVEICEDVWAPEPVSTHLALAGADIVCNLSASDELTGKHAYLRGLLVQQSARAICGYVYSSSGFGESSQDVVFGGNAMICENGTMLAEGERFSLEPQLMISEIDVERLRSERRKNTTFLNAQTGHTCKVLALDGGRNDGETENGIQKETIAASMSLQTNEEEDAFSVLKYRKVEKLPFVPAEENMRQSCQEVFNIQVGGLAQRLRHINAKTVVVGISGGLDSTLALLVCVKTFDKLGYDRKGIIGVTMPGFGTSDRTYHNALALMESLGVTMKEISIAKAVMQHFEDIGHDAEVHDVTYENSQARERTQILMDLTNELGGIVVGTGDMSELALGWATYNGDHMSMYGVNAGIPKTLIQYMVRYVANNEVEDETGRVLNDIVDTPISPELTPADEEGNIAQKTEDLVGPYELHDFFMYYFLRYGFRPRKIFMLARVAFAGDYDRATIQKWMTKFFGRFFSQQFKRSCLPDGPKVGSVSLSPRGDWRMASDACCDLWLKECNML